MMVGFSPAHIAALGRDVAVCLYARETEHAPQIQGETRFISAAERYQMKPDAFRRDLDPELANRIRREMYDVYIRCHVREAFRQQQFDKSWLDYNNHFENALHYYYGLIKDHSIDVIVFEILPHEGTHIILYALGRALGLRVILCHQSIFRGAFMICEAVPELGLSPVTNQHGLEIKINRKPESPFYTKTLRGRMSWLSYAKKAGWSLAKLAGRSLALQPLWNWAGYRKALLKFRELNSFYQARNLPDEIYSDFDSDAPYVYVSLHMQPELNTDVLGGRYCDQLLMLEELSRTLPDDFVIYTKEHPQQKMHQRDPSYFERLRQIPKVRYLRVEESPFAIVHGARAVATVAGTAGWEALQMGKPVLCFGAAWYRGFPGVFDWRDGPQASVEAALRFQPDLDALQSACDERAKSLWPGLVNTVYAQLLDHFDPEENITRVARSIDEYLTAADSSGAAAEKTSIETAFLD